MTEVFVSGFADLILDYIDFYEESGRKRTSIYYPLNFFDRYCYEKYQDKQIFTAVDAFEIYESKPNNISQRTFYAWTGALQSFTGYLFAMGYDVGIVQQTGNIKEQPFIPYIYSPDEKKAYTIAADHYNNPHHPYLCQLLPIIVRTLQCCGLRISEVLNLKKSDIAINNEVPYLLIRNTKNELSRYAPLSDSLASLYRSFNATWMYRLDDDDYVFVNSKGDQLSHSFIYEVHKDLLAMAHIKYEGNGKGPRIHDWRHTFCVESYQKLLDMGLHERNALLLISVMMGHQHFSATEKYLRLTKHMFPRVIESLDLLYKDLG